MIVMMVNFFRKPWLSPPQKRKAFFQMQTTRRKEIPKQKQKQKQNKKQK